MTTTATRTGSTLAARLEAQKRRTEIALLKVQEESAGLTLRAMSGSYESRTGRLKRDRSGTAATRGGSADAHRDRRSIQEQRAAAQHLNRTHPLARGLVQRHIDLAVSDGFRLQVKTGDAGFNAEVRAAFNEWADTLGGAGPDIRGLLTLDEMAADLVRAADLDGDRLTLLTESGHLQSVEAERVISPVRGALDSPTMRSGVELDAVGRPVRFHIAEWYQDGSTLSGRTAARAAGEGTLWWTNPMQSTAGATRGEPQLVASIGRLEDLDQFDTAVRAAARMAACFGLIFKRLNPAGAQGMMPGAVVSLGGSGAGGAPTEEKEIEYQPGMSLHLRPDEDVVPVQGAQPQDNYQDFVFTQVMMAGADQTVPLFLSMLDGRQVNLASMRAMMQIVWRNVLRVQNALDVRFYRPVYRFWLARRIRAGEFPALEDWSRAEFVAPPPPSMDAKTDIEAGRLAVQSRQKSPSRVMREIHGIDFEDELEAMALDFGRLKALGLMPVEAPGTDAAGGGPDRSRPGDGEDRDENGPKSGEAEDGETEKSPGGEADGGRPPRSAPRAAPPKKGGEGGGGGGGGAYLVGDKTLASDLVGDVAAKRKPAESAKKILTEMVGLGETTADSIIAPADGFAAPPPPTAPEAE